MFNMHQRPDRQTAESTAQCKTDIIRPQLHLLNAFAIQSSFFSVVSLIHSFTEIPRIQCDDPYMTNTSLMAILQTVSV